MNALGWLGLGAVVFAWVACEVWERVQDYRYHQAVVESMRRHPAGTALDTELGEFADEAEHMNTPLYDELAARAIALTEIAIAARETATNESIHAWLEDA